MHRLFAPVVAPLIEAADPRVIVETGCGSGRLTRRILDSPSARNASIHAIDPSPALAPRLIDNSAGRLEVHAERAISAIGRIGAVDLALLDGDPNWYSAHTELTMLIEGAERAGRPAPAVVVHHVHWPFGRRDGYYDPAAIPPAHRHRHSDLGLLPGQRDPSPEGLRLTPHCALADFEPRSGVLSAVEDLVADSDLDWTLVEVPGFHGCAVLAEARLLAERPAVAGVIEGLRASRFLGRQVRRAESARLELEVRLAAAPAAPEAAREARPEPEPVEAAPEQLETIRVLESERLTLLGELAEHRAHREALEWRIGRLDEDLGARDRRIEAAVGERDAERRQRDEAAHALVEVRVRLEEATDRLASERAAAEGLRGKVAELDEQADARDRELREALEREQLAQGRLSHREEALQAATAEAERLRREVEGLRRELAAGRELLDEIALIVERAAATRWARLGRRFSRIGRAVTFRRAAAPHPYELAKVAAERGLPASGADAGSEDSAVDPSNALEAELERRR